MKVEHSSSFSVEVKMSGAIPPLYHIPTRRTQRKLHFIFTLFEAQQSLKSCSLDHITGFTIPSKATAYGDVQNLIQ
jgi:hypothetical protein